MSDLRKDIEAAIAAAGDDAERAAMNVCLLLEDTLGLSAQGCFDGDDKLAAAIDSNHAAQRAPSFNEIAYSGEPLEEISLWGSRHA